MCVQICAGIEMGVGVVSMHNAHLFLRHDTILNLVDIFVEALKLQQLAEDDMADNARHRQ